MLNLLGYRGEKILEKHIIDNSCGDGAFLTEIVLRYCNEFLKKYNKTEGLKENLEKYIHGIEIQQEEVKKCISRLNEIAGKFGLTDIAWDIVCGDALTIKQYDNKMDFVVGNPPYIRIHNLGSIYPKVKSLKLANFGMTDLYLAFFEISFNMLKEDGKMCLITPNSFLTSKAGSKLRKYIYETKNLKLIVDFGHIQPFKGVTTYPLITLFDNTKKHAEIIYYEYNGKLKKVDELKYDEVFINSKIYLSTRENLLFLKEVENTQNKTVKVKNGFATLADEVFIKENFAFTEGTIKVLKASTGKWYKCIFPYDEQGNPLTLEQISQNKPLYNYLLQHKKKLIKRSIKDKDSWFLFGRNQGIKDVFQDKIAINNLIKEVKDIKLIQVPAGSGVFGGLYILGLTIEKAEKLIKTEKFLNYIKALKKYKSGGYYTFSAEDLEKFLNYQLNLGL